MQDAIVLVYQDKGEEYQQCLDDYRHGGAFTGDINRAPVYDVREYERTVRAGGYSTTVYVIVAKEIA